MKPRKKTLGTINVVGASITKIRIAKGMKQKELLAKLQTQGMELTASCLSKIEGQTKQVTDKDLVYIARALEVSVQDLFANT